MLGEVELLGKDELLKDTALHTCGWKSDVQWDST
jgi:hypothetical protein